MRIISKAHQRTLIVLISMISILLLAGCGSMSTLQSAAGRNDVQGINNLLAKGVYVDATDGGGWTIMLIDMENISHNKSSEIV